METSICAVRARRLYVTEVVERAELGVCGAVDAESLCPAPRILVIIQLP